MASTRPCPECGRRFPDGDRLVDHLSDEHDAFSWLVQGRPMAREGADAR